MKFGEFETRFGVAAFANAREIFCGVRRILLDAASFDICAACSQAATVCPSFAGACVQNGFGSGIIIENGGVVEVREFDTGASAVVETRRAKKLDAAC